MPRPTSAAASVRVDLSVIRAEVSAKRTSCRSAKRFLRRHRSELCDTRIRTIDGWTKRYGGEYEAVILTLSRGKKRIRTDACGS